MDSEVRNVIATAPESAKNPHFHGLSQKLESCGVPARLKTFELSAHQMPHRHPCSEVQPWIHGEQPSRESYTSLVNGGLPPGGFEDSFVWLAQKARPAQKRIQKRIATLSPMDLGQELRERQASTLQAEEAMKTATEQLIHASSRVPKKARTRLAMMSFSGPTARQDVERAEKCRWLAHLGQRLMKKPAACNSMGLGLRSGTLRKRVHALLAGHVSSSSVPFSRGAYAGLLGAQGGGTVHSSGVEGGSPELGKP